MALKFKNKWLSLYSEQEMFFLYFLSINQKKKTSKKIPCLLYTVTHMK